MGQPDPNALQVAQAVHHDQKPHITILFGSRARGDHHQHSDIDIMLLEPQPPDQEGQDTATSIAGEAARRIFGRHVPVQLVWRTPEEFRERRRFSNSVETRAAREGTATPGPEEYSACNYEDDDTEYEFDWNPFDEHMRHAESHLEAFVIIAEMGQNDIVIGQQGQNTLEFAMKALLEAHGAGYHGTHNISHLLGNVRRTNPELSNFQLSIPPNVYTAYKGDQQYRQRVAPRITEFPNYMDRTTADAETIIERAKEVRRINKAQDTTE